MNAFLSIGAGISEGFAAEWSVEPQLSVRGEYNDNLLLTALPHDPTYGAWISPELRGNFLREDFEIRGNSHWDFVEFIDNPGLDIIQHFYDASALYRTERSEWNVTGTYTRDSVLGTELKQTGVVGELGTVGKRRIRKLLSAQPSWRFMVTEQIIMLASYTYSDVSFDTPAGSGFSNFNNHDGVLGFTYQPFERTQIRVTGVYSNFHSPPANNRTITHGGEVELSHSISETFNISLMGGLRLVSSKFPTLNASLQVTTARNDDLLPVFGGNLQKQFDRFSVNAGGSRRITTSGVGRFNKTDRLTLSITHSLTEHIRLSLSGELFQIKSLSDQNVQIPEATYSIIRPSLSWQIWEDLTFNADFSYRGLERKSPTGTNTTVTSNSIAFSFTYNFPKLATSE